MQEEKIIFPGNIGKLYGMKIVSSPFIPEDTILVNEKYYEMLKKEYGEKPLTPPE